MRARRWIFLFLAIVAASGAGLVLKSVDRQREELGLGGYQVIGDAPPSLVLATTAMGGFRAIAIDLLWIRATDLQEEGRFFELVQLFDWICMLQPRFPGVWAHAAWNQAYNVSANFPPSQPGERWRWVKRGLELLRDRGIPHNQRAVQLYQELAWIYLHKIAGSGDVAHPHYKGHLAMEMEDALGVPPYGWLLEAMTNALAKSETFKDVILTDPDVSALLKQLVLAGVEPFEDPIAFIQRRIPPSEDVKKLFEDEANQPTLKRLELLLRAHHLSKNLSLDPKWMSVLTKAYGPIDWRLPEALALYWSTAGAKVLGDDVSRADNLNRVVFTSIYNLYQRGTLRFRRGSEGTDAVYVVSPNFAFLKTVEKLYLETLSRYEAAGDDVPTRDAYLDFLRNAVMTLYLHNSIKLARKYYNKLQPEGTPNRMELRDFVLQRYWDKIKGDALAQPQAVSLIQGFVLQSLFWSSLGDTEQGVGQYDLAERLHKLYNKKRGRRLHLPPFPQLRDRAVEQALRSFRPFQLEALRELFPKQIEKVEKELQAQQKPVEVAPAEGESSTEPEAEERERPDETREE